MNTWKRVLAIVIMALSVILTILCIAGIVGNWLVNDSMTKGIVQVLTKVENTLSLADDALGRLDTRVSSARERVVDFEETVQTAGDNFVENPVILTALSEKLDLGIEPAINELRETVQTVRETVIGIQNTIQALNTIPFISVGEDVSDWQSLQELSEGIAALTEAVQETRNGVREAKKEVATQVGFAIGKGTSRLDSGLAAIETAVSGYGTRLSELRAEVSAFKTSLILWLDVASVIMTLFLLWLIFSQGVVFVLGLSVYRNENLFARWMGGSVPQPLEEPGPEASEDSSDGDH